MNRDQDFDFGQALLTLRSAMALTQTQLADALGVSRRAIVGWEAGSTYPKEEHFRKLIALAVRQRAFPAGREEAETRALWKLSRQKVLLPEDWLADLLSLGALSVAPSLTSFVPVSTAEATQATASQRNAPVNLPFQPTAFFGRQHELREISRILADPACRLLTLIGPGGIGKTRLSLEYAAGQVGQFVDGVVFVPLASVGTVNQIASAVADALNLAFGGQADPTAQLLGFLRERQMLLILDNFEHLVAGADLIAEILLRAPRVTVLVTSRERLNLRTEWLFDLEGMRYPPEDPRGDRVYSRSDLTDYDAVQLFMQRVIQIQPGFPIVESTLLSMARICRHVSGMPLAIELAAAGVRMMPLVEIERQIQSNLDVLATTFRDMPARHRSLRAVFDHSWNLLTEPERALLSRLAVFRGGCTAAAAMQVAGATLPALTALIDKSLLRQISLSPVADGTAPEPRFALLEPIREYALEKLAARGEVERLRRAHATCYLALAESVAAHWDRPTVETRIEQLDFEYDNIRAALQWARDGGELSLGFQLGWALRKFWQRRGYYSEGRLWLEELLALDDADSSTASKLARLRGMHTAAWLASDQHDYARATHLFEQSRALSRSLGETDVETGLIAPEARQARAEGHYRLATALFEGALAQYRARGDRQSFSAGGLGLSLYELALVLREQGDFARAGALFEECLDLHRALGDREGITVVLMGLGDIARDRGDVEQTRYYSQQSLAGSRELRMQWAVGYSLNNLALAASMDDQLSEAAVLCGESIDLFRSIHADGGLGEILVTQGHILRAQGEIALADEVLTEALRLALTYGPRLLVAAALEALACVMALSEDAITATRLLAGASALRAEMGTPVRPADRPAIARAVDVSRSLLGDEDFEALWAEAVEQPLEQLLEPPQLSA